MMLKEVTKHFVKTISLQTPTHILINKNSIIQFVKRAIPAHSESVSTTCAAVNFKLLSLYFLRIIRFSSQLQIHQAWSSHTARNIVYFNVLFVVIVNWSIIN